MAAERHVVLAVLLIALASACGDQKPVAAVATLGGEDADAADDLTSADGTDLPDAATADTAPDDVTPDAGTDAAVGVDADAAPDALDTADNADVGDAQDVADVADAVDAATEIAGTDAAGPDNGTDAEAPDVGADVAEGTDAAAVDTQDAGTDAATGCKSAGDCPAAGDACHVAVCNLDGSCGFGNAADGKVCTNAGSCAGAGTCATGVCVTAQGPLTAANVSTVAGSGLAGAQDGAPASASFNQPYGLAHLSDGGMVVTDLDGNRVRQIKADGTVSTLAGTGSAGSADGPAASATFNQPKGIAVAANGDIFIVDQANHRIRRLSGGVVTTFAGATAGFKDGIGTGALFNNPVDLQFAPDGTLWVADQTNNRIRRILPDGTVTTVIGNGTAGTVDGPVGNSQVNAPQRLAVAADRTLYFMDGGAFRLRKLSPDGTTVSTVTGTTSGYVDGPTATAKLGATGGIALVGQAIVLSDRDANRIRVVAPDGTVGTLAGSGATSYLDGAPSSATFGYLNGLATDKGGNVWIADGNNNRIRKLTFTFPTCNDNNPCTTDTCASNACTFTQLAAGTSCDDGTPCTTGDVCTGAGACVGAAKDCDDKNVCTADYCNPLTVGCSHIAIANWATCDDGSACTSGDTCFYGSCMASPVGTVGTIAGSGTAGYLDGPGSSAQFNSPKAISSLPDGSMLVAEFKNNRIRKLGTNGSVSTFAGSGAPGGQNGPAASAQFAGPHGIHVASTGVVYVSDFSGGRIRAIALDGTVSTLAGAADGSAGYVDATGPTARFNQPTFILEAPDGSLYVADYGNHAIRNVSVSGTVSTLVGGKGSGGKDGPASIAQLNGPVGMTFDPAGNLYIAEKVGQRIRRLGIDGTVSTVFGSGAAGFGEGVGVLGQLNYPFGIVWAPEGFLLVADQVNCRIRAVWPDGLTTSIAGDGMAGYLDGSGNVAKLKYPTDLTFLSDGTLAVVDDGNNRIRKITLNSITCNDNNPCTADACNPATGACVFTPIAAGGACNDGNACTTGDVCTNLVCAGTLNCQDGDPCTMDACDTKAKNCTHTFKTGWQAPACTTCAPGFAGSDCGTCTDASKTWPNC